MKPLKFIHISKTAGTFVERQAIKEKISWGWFHRHEYGYWHRIFPNIDKKIKDKYDWFTIVRNPYDRILSEYYCVWGGIGYKVRNHSTEQFNQFLINKINNIELKGCHYTEQYKYIDDKYNIHIIKYENLNEELALLFNKYNLNIDLEGERLYTKESQNRNKNLFTTNDFNNELITLINEVYDKDFTLFDYKKREV